MSVFLDYTQWNREIKLTDTATLLNPVAFIYLGVCERVCVPLSWDLELDLALIGYQAAGSRFFLPSALRWLPRHQMRWDTHTVSLRADTRSVHCGNRCLRPQSCSSCCCAPQKALELKILYRSFSYLTLDRFHCFEMFRFVNVLCHLCLSLENKTAPLNTFW